MRRLRLLRIPGSILGGLAITVLCFWFIATLNLQAVVGLDSNSRIRTVVLQGPESESSPRQQPEDEPDPETPETEVMEVKMEMPTPETVQLDPLELDLAMPSPEIPAIQVAIKTVPEPPKKPTPRPSKPAPAAEPTVRSASSVDQPPRESARNTSPTYPTRERQLGIEATVRMRLLINEAGNVEDVQFVRGPEAFRRAILDVVMTWRFTPARHRGKPVKTWAVKDVQFTRSGRG